MRTAPPADQRRLLDIQELDTRLAQLAHQRRTHPSLAALEELEARAGDLDRARTQAEVTLGDARKELVKAETDVEQVRTRAARGHERLSSGHGTPKELQNTSAELEALERRQGVLEEAQLEHMEAVEEAERELEAITAQRTALHEQVADVTHERDTVFSQIDNEAESVSASRGRLSEGLAEGLLKLYEDVRSRTGGLGAVALRGESTVGIQVPLSLTEKAEIKAASPEQIIQSEEHDYLLIRIED